MIAGLRYEGQVREGQRNGAIRRATALRRLQSAGVLLGPLAGFVCFITSSINFCSESKDYTAASIYAPGRSSTRNCSIPRTIGRRGRSAGSLYRRLCQQLSFQAEPSFGELDQGKGEPFINWIPPCRSRGFKQSS